jgi:hypothetical protein
LFSNINKLDMNDSNKIKSALGSVVGEGVVGYEDKK